MSIVAESVRRLGRPPSHRRKAKSSMQSRACSAERSVRSEMRYKQVGGRPNTLLWMESVLIPGAIDMICRKSMFTTSVSPCRSQPHPTSNSSNPRAKDRLRSFGEINIMDVGFCIPRGSTESSSRLGRSGAVPHHRPTKAQVEG